MSKKIRVDLHNHTTLCNHATGSVEEYVKRAIELGIDEYGFACHAPMNFDPKYRMKLEERNIYEKWVNETKEKYKDKIKVLLAYEVDFLNGFMLDEILNANVDYLIGSVHFLQNKNEMWGFDNPEFIGVYKSVDIDKIWEDYFEDSVYIIAENVDLDEKIQDRRAAQYNYNQQINKYKFIREINVPEQITNIKAFSRYFERFEILVKKLDKARTNNSKYKIIKALKSISNEEYNHDIIYYDSYKK